MAVVIAAHFAVRPEEVPDQTPQMTLMLLSRLPYVVAPGMSKQYLDFPEHLRMIRPAGG